MTIKLDIDNEQNFIDLWNDGKKIWERYVKVNDEIEIIEDEKIEKLPTNGGMLYATDGEMTLVVNKINEIIDKINEMENK